MHILSNCYFTILFFTDTDDCDPDPCQNGATCRDQVDGYTCDCAAGYEGDHCETGG